MTNSFSLQSRGIHVSGAAIVNILEEQIEDLDLVTDVDTESIDLEFRAFEVKTVRVKLLEEQQ
jgi:alpha-mannosidase